MKRTKKGKFEILNPEENRFIDASHDDVSETEEEFLGTLPMDVQEIAKKFPFGIYVDRDNPEKDWYLVGYGKSADGDKYCLVMTEIDPRDDPERALKEVVYMPVDQFAGVEKVEPEHEYLN